MLGEHIHFPLPDGSLMRVPVRRHPRAKYARISVQKDSSLLITLPTGRKLDAKEMIAAFSDWVNKIWAKGDLTYHHPDFPATIYIPLLNKTFTVTKDNSISIDELVYETNGDHIVYKQCSFDIVVLRKGNQIFVSESRSWPQIFDEYKIVALQKYLYVMAQRYLTKSIIDVARENCFPAIGVKIGNQRSKWASCSIWHSSHKYVIHLNWRAILLPVELLYHLYFHELVHIIYQNHSKDFYNTLEKYSENSRAKEKRLDDVSRRMPAWVKYHEKYLIRLTDFALSSV